ncbi:MAG: hypothetical protein WD397_11495 [Wenzhouxiangellaceae bacterium]
MASDQQSEERVTTMRYTVDGYFVDGTTNPKGQTAEMDTDPREGNVTRLTGIDGQTVRMAYDVFGREVETWFPVNADNDTLTPTPGSHYAPRSSTRYQWAGGCPGTGCGDNGEVYTVSSITDGSPVTVETLDRLNRVVARQTNGLNDTIHEVMRYTARAGRQHQRAEFRRHAPGEPADEVHLRPAGPAAHQNRAAKRYRLRHAQHVLQLLGA